MTLWIQSQHVWAVPSSEQAPDACVQQAGVPTNGTGPSPSALTMAPPLAMATRSPVASSYCCGCQALGARVRMDARSNLGTGTQGTGKMLVHGVDTESWSWLLPLFMHGHAERKVS